MKHIVVLGAGVSGLASAYLLKQQALCNGLELKITILEKNSYCGGKIRSLHENGYLCEWGPNGFLTNKPETLSLCESLGLSKQLLASNDNARKRFIFFENKLYKLPHGLGEFLSNRLITLKGKLRIIAEVFIPSRKSLDDETLADFTRRRLGKEALRKLITPMVGGIFAGDPEKMSLSACFPKINQLEKKYGGLIKAMFYLAIKHKFDPTKKNIPQGGAAGPGGILTSFKGGIQVLTDELVTQLGKENIYTNVDVSKINSLKNGTYQIEYFDEKQKQILFCDSILCATPAHIAKDIFASLNSKLHQDLSRINYSPLIVVCCGYSFKDIAVDLNGFGYLRVNDDNTPNALGTLWDSSIFVNRAPDGKVLLRTMLGGARNPEIIGLTDLQIQELVCQNLEQVMGIKCMPEFIQIFRHEKAIPAYDVGHLELLTKIEEEIKTCPGVFLTGNAYCGVGINDCVGAAYKTSSQILDFLSKVS